MPTPAQNRSPAQIRAAAQRRTSREIKAGTFKPSAIGAQSRKIASESKRELIERVTQLRIDLYGNEGRRDYDRENLVVKDPESGKKRTVGELRKIASAMEGLKEKKGNRNWIPEHVWNEFDPDDYDIDDVDITAFYYH